MLTEAYVGRILDRRYRLVEFMASGGMALLFRAVHVGTGRTLAVKLLRPEFRENSEFVRRFQREAWLTAQLKHEHVVDILDVQIEDECYLVMEYLSGIDLRTCLRQMGRIPWSRVRTMMLQICSALQCAHDHGVVHRDLKPANCFQLAETGQIKVLDFGIAKPLSPLLYDGSQITRTGSLAGTPEYMAPEQFFAEADPRSDIYSAGVLMFELLTGKRPFRGKGAELLRLIASAPPPHFASIADDLDCPAALEAVVRRALEKLPEQRFPDTREFVRAIAACDAGPSEGTDLRRAADDVPAQLSGGRNRDAWLPAGAVNATEPPIDPDAESPQTAGSVVAVGEPAPGHGDPAMGDARAAPEPVHPIGKGVAPSRKLAVAAAGIVAMGVAWAVALPSRAPAEDPEAVGERLEPSQVGGVDDATEPPTAKKPQSRAPGKDEHGTDESEERTTKADSVEERPPSVPVPEAVGTPEAPPEDVSPDPARASTADRRASASKAARPASSKAIERDIFEILRDEEVGALISQTRVTLRLSPTGEVLEATVHGLPRGADRARVESRLRTLRVRTTSDTFEAMFKLPLPQ